MWGGGGGGVGAQVSPAPEAEEAAGRQEKRPPACPRSGLHGRSQVSPEPLALLVEEPRASVSGAGKHCGHLPETPTPLPAQGTCRGVRGVNHGPLVSEVRPRLQTQHLGPHTLTCSP
ncbi:hypothetical protein VULLAG_LOCUS22608 [Vulpes lagopus]